MIISASRGHLLYKHGFKVVVVFHVVPLTFSPLKNIKSLSLSITIPMVGSPYYILRTHGLILNS